MLRSFDLIKYPIEKVVGRSMTLEESSEEKEELFQRAPFKRYKRQNNGREFSIDG